MSTKPTIATLKAELANETARRHAAEERRALVEDELRHINKVAQAAERNHVVAAEKKAERADLDSIRNGLIPIKALRDLITNIHTERSPGSTAASTHVMLEHGPNRGNPVATAIIETLTKAETRGISPFQGSFDRFDAFKYASVALSPTNRFPNLSGIYSGDVI